MSNIGPTMGGLPEGFDRSDIMHVCPECGGQTTSLVGALIIVQTCWACFGTGLLSTEDLGRYITEANRRTEKGLT